MARGTSLPAGLSTEYFSESDTGQSSRYADPEASSRTSQTSRDEGRARSEPETTRQQESAASSDSSSAEGSSLPDTPREIESAWISESDDEDSSEIPDDEYRTSRGRVVRGAEEIFAASRTDVNVISHHRTNPAFWNTPRFEVSLSDLLVNQITHDLEMVIDDDLDCPIQMWVRQRLHENACPCLCHLGEGIHGVPWENGTDAYESEICEQWSIVSEMYPSTPCRFEQHTFARGESSAAPTDEGEDDEYDDDLAFTYEEMTGSSEDTGSHHSGSDHADADAAAIPDPSPLDDGTSSISTWVTASTNIAMTNLTSQPSLSDQAASQGTIQGVLAAPRNDKGKQKAPDYVNDHDVSAAAVSSSSHVELSDSDAEASTGINPSERILELMDDSGEIIPPEAVRAFLEISDLFGGELHWCLVFDLYSFLFSVIGSIIESGLEWPGVTNL